MSENDPRATLDRLIRDNGDDYLTLSRLLGRNDAYVQQYIKRGSPKKLPEQERGILARYFGVSEQLLGASDEGGGPKFQLVPKLAIGASAGGGALQDSETLAGKVGFDQKWLRQMGVNPARLSLIQVKGDSMQPTLNDGDDIMVDTSAAGQPVKAAIYVLRHDGALLVKRLLPEGEGVISIISDNPEYAMLPNVSTKNLAIIGRVVWVGRKL